VSCKRSMPRLGVVSCSQQEAARCRRDCLAIGFPLKKKRVEEHLASIPLELAMGSK
jgi:hypothetical protein